MLLLHASQLDPTLEALAMAEELPEQAAGAAEGFYQRAASPSGRSDDIQVAVCISIQDGEVGSSQIVLRVRKPPSFVALLAHCCPSRPLVRTKRSATTFGDAGALGAEIAHFARTYFACPPELEERRRERNS